MFRERKEIMKAQNIMKSLVISIILLAGVVQAWAVTYKGNYQPSAISRQYSAGSYQGVVAPAVGFQSTSAYAAPEWAEQPMLNSDGTVNEGAYMGGRNYAPGRPRRVDANNDGYDDETGLPVNPIVDDEGNVPLGDAALPLMLLAIAYCGRRFLRRRKEA